MDALIGFLTSGTGVVAGLLALLGLVAAVQKVVLPVLDRRREARGSRADLALSGMAVEDPPPWSEAGRATFQLMNRGGGKAVLASLTLQVVEHGPVERPKMIEAAAPIPQFTYKVELSPDVAEYDVRKKAFGTAPPHSYEKGEVEAFEVELRSTEPRWYRFRFRVGWYDVAEPEAVRELVSAEGRIEFAPDIEALV